MRDAIARLGGDTAKINPLVPVNLVIDHSVMVDEFGHPKAFEQNVELEYARNAERYDFLKWGSKSFRNFSAVPPGTGICHRPEEHTSELQSLMRISSAVLCLQKKNNIQTPTSTHIKHTNNQTQQ